MDSKEGGWDNGDSEPIRLAQNILFDLLQNSRRRALLRHLETHGKLDLSEAARLIAADENGVDLDEIDENSLRSVYISLYQTHVPKLSSHDIIEYDRDASTVELRDTAEQLLVHIHLDERDENEDEAESGWVNIFDKWFNQ